MERRFFFLFEHQVHLFYDKFSVIPQFSRNLMRESLDKVVFSSSILRTFCGFPFELDKPTGLHDVTLMVTIEVDC